MATTILSQRWHRSPRIFEPAGHYDGGQPYWEVDSVTVRVNGEKLSVESTHRSERPDMRIDVYEGELRLPLEDLIPQVLDRLEVEDLARMITADEAARRCVLDALARYYNDAHIEDADRRHWIAATKAAVHDRALDRLVDAMSSLERHVAALGYRAMSDIAYDNVLDHELRDAGVDPEKAREARHRYQPRQELIDFRPYVDTIGFGQGAWNDARDYWREQTKAMFANVEVPEREPESAQ